MQLHKLFESTPSKTRIQKMAVEFYGDYDSELGKFEWGAPLSIVCREPGGCSMVTHTFIEWLRNTHGVDASFLVGYDAVNKKWRVEIDGEPNAHTVALVGNTVIDFTAKQFDALLPCPRIMTLSEFNSEWNSISRFA